MYQLKVPDMSCGHCVNTSTEAITSADSEAQIDFDLVDRQVSVDTHLTQQQVADLLTEAGYKPA